jgi:hypothetical protein
MSTSVARAAAPGVLERARSLQVLFVGSPVLLGSFAPTAPAEGFSYGHLRVDPGASLADVLATREGPPVDVSIVLDPESFARAELAALPGATVGVLTEARSEGGGSDTTSGRRRRRAEESAREPPIPLDRLVSLDPARTGEALAGSEIWRAMAPPVSDAMFAEVRKLHRAPRVLSIGRWSEHREAMLLPAKHHHDLLQVIHGVVGEELGELLVEYDVGVFAPREHGGGFGQQVALHLAAGHLLVSFPLEPAHGLERDIDYLEVDSPKALVWVLDRLTRFPEMHQRIRVRGRMKAEQFRASRVFARLVYDLLADIAAFGEQR